ncbi:MAG: aldo/keto reductase [Blastochloris sp.]|nr:aldo/keto reductase [Blastochloris sp.]
MYNRYDLMKYQRCGESGLMLPLVSLGAWHNFNTFESARSLTLKAWDLGITHIDFANNYGPPPGIAETHFGYLIKGELAMHRDELIIATKAGYRMWDGPYGEWGSKKHLFASLHQSLKRLQLDYVDIFYSHRYDPNTPLEETMGALAQMIREGKALYAGISSYPAKAVKKAAKIMRDLCVPLIINQSSYNLLDRSIEGKVLEETQEAGLGMIVFCPLAQGLLTDRYLQGIPTDSRAASASIFLNSDRITPLLSTVLIELNTLALTRGQTLARMSLNWILRDRRITSLLIGASKPEQIEDCVAVQQDEPFTAEELRRIETILAQLNPPPPEPAPRIILKPITKTTKPKSAVPKKGIAPKTSN